MAERGGVTECRSALLLVGIVTGVLLLGDGAPHIEFNPGVGTMGSSVMMASKPFSISVIWSNEDEEPPRGCCAIGIGIPLGNAMPRGA